MQVKQFKQSNVFKENPEDGDRIRPVTSEDFYTLTQLSAQEHFIQFVHHESFKKYV